MSTDEIDDPLMMKADALVDVASINAVSALLPISNQFPFLRASIATSDDEKRWDLILTIAAVYIAATRLRNLEFGGSREKALMQKVTERLEGWEPSRAVRAFENCKAVFAQNFDLLTARGHEARFIASDAIGMWIGWNVLDRAPVTDEEWAFVHQVGVLVTHGFFNWWDEKRDAGQ